VTAIVRVAAIFGDVALLYFPVNIAALLRKNLFEHVSSAWGSGVPGSPAKRSVVSETT